MNKEFLELVGLDFYEPQEFKEKNVKLRNGDDALLWVHTKTGHGILDKKNWIDSVYTDYYEDNYRKNSSANSDGSNFKSDTHFDLYRVVNKKQFDHVRPYLSNSAKYLEIGPSFGGVLSNVLSHGISECHCVEPNKSDCNYIKSKYDNVTIYNSKIEDTKLQPAYYDIITSFEVLEHMVSVKSYLQTCFNALKMNGNIIIEVPNHNDVLLSCYKSPRYKKFYYHNAHIHYFTTTSLIDICNKYGFDGSVESFQIYPFFNHVNWCINDTPQSSAEDAINTPIPTNGNSTEQIAINNFYKKVELMYDDLINDFKLGGEIIFKGKKNNIQNSNLQ